MKSRVCILMLVSIFAFGRGDAISGNLIDPFSAKLPIATVSELDLSSCKSVPPPVVTLATVSRYQEADPSKSKIDPKRESDYEKDIKPLRDFQSEIVGWANDSVRKPKDVKKALCAYVWLQSWANGHSLTDLTTRQSEFNRDQALAALALAYLQIRGVDPGPSIKRAVIVDWLVTLASAAIDHYENGAGEMSRRNNHRSFAALGVAAAGIAANDQKLFDWSMDWLRQATCSATPEGALLPEMERGERARHYQLFGSGPLVILAEMALVNGLDPYTWCDGRLHRIVAFSIASISDPSAVEMLANEKQMDMPPREKWGSRLGWLVPYSRRFPSDEFTNLLDGLDSLSSTALGGNQNVLYPAR